MSDCVRNIIIVVGVLMVFWQVIFPKYQSYKYEKEAREYFKTNLFEDVQKEISSKQTQGLQVDFLNQYPNIRIYQNFLVDVVAVPELLNKDTFQQVWCGQWNTLTEIEPRRRSAMMNVLEQDNVTFYSVTKDKFGKEIFSFQQRISDCPNFAKIREAKQGEVIEETQEVTFMPTAAPAVSSHQSEAAASVQ